MNNTITLRHNGGWIYIRKKEVKKWITLLKAVRSIIEEKKPKGKYADHWVGATVEDIQKKVHIDRATLGRILLKLWIADCIQINEYGQS